MKVRQLTSVSALEAKAQDPAKFMTFLLSITLLERRDSENGEMSGVLAIVSLFKTHS